MDRQVLSTTACLILLQHSERGRKGSILNGNMHRRKCARKIATFDAHNCRYHGTASGDDSREVKESLSFTCKILPTVMGGRRQDLGFEFLFAYDLTTGTFRR